MTANANAIPGTRVLPHERMQTCDLGAHTLEVIEETCDLAERTIRITAQSSSDLDGHKTVEEDVCLSWEEAYKLLITLQALFYQDRNESQCDEQ
jgi:hypothetical protein